MGHLSPSPSLSSAVEDGIGPRKQGFEASDLLAGPPFPQQLLEERTGSDSPNHDHVARRYTGALS